MQREKAALQEAMDDYVVVRLQALEAKVLTWYACVTFWPSEVFA
jgi:hypothetical protein